MVVVWLSFRDGGALVVLWWCFCGGEKVVVLCWCGGVFVMSWWLCFLGGGVVVVFLWWGHLFFNSTPFFGASECGDGLLYPPQQGQFSSVGITLAQ